jgi:LEA14-like dessication related protein
MNMRKWSLGLLVAAGVAAGCASLGRQSFKDPIVTFKDARVTGLGVTGGSIEIVLEVKNPNHYRLDGTRLTYRVLVDSIPFGDGAFTDKFNVDEGSTKEVRLPFTFSYNGVGAAGRQLIQTGSVEYHVTGDITVQTPVGSFTRPYDQRGRFSTLSGAR